MEKILKLLEVDALTCRRLRMHRHSQRKHTHTHRRIRRFDYRHLRARSYAWELG
jgi:hypothetical protein